MNRVMFAILSILDSHQGPARSSQIVSHLAAQGVEIPGESLFASRWLTQKLIKCGFRNTTLHGYAFQPLLGIHVTEGMVGLVELGGLNPSAALAEAGLSVGTRAMATMHEYTDLRPVSEHLERKSPGLSATRGIRAGKGS